MVRAKFRCVQIAPSDPGHPDSDLKSITLHPVVGDGSPENEAFFKWTPSGDIHLNCCNPAATAQFEQGKNFYVDFSPAEA